VLYDGDIDISPGEYRELSSLVPRALQPMAEIGAGAMIPVSTKARNVLPTLPLAVVRIGVRHLGRDWLRGELEAAFVTAGGEDVLSGGSLRAPFHVSGAELSIGAAAEASLPRGWSMGIGAGAGTILLTRDYQGPVSGHQSLRAMTGTIHVEGGWSPLDRLHVDARLGAMAIFGSIQASNGPHLVLMPTLQTAVSF
jgi:hypothetical protein